MDFVRRKRTCVFAVLLFGIFGIATTSYYLSFKSRVLTSSEVKKRVEIDLLKSTHRSMSTLSQHDITDVKMFLFFVGHPRSGHSILASMIDAHPNAIVAHELNLFPKFVRKPDLLTNRTTLYNALFENSRKQASRGWRSLDHSFKTKGYSLNMNNSHSWQGTFKRLRVIGDKSGGVTSRLYHNSPENFSNLYKQLSKIVKVPIKVIYMIRNPYDMVATHLMFRFSGYKEQKANFSAEHPLDNPGNVTQAMKVLYNEAKAVEAMIKTLNVSVLEVHNIDFVQKPRSEMKRVCDFLHIQCSAPYLEMVARGTYSKLSVTRHSVVWPLDAREFIDTKILTIPCFSRYSFNTEF